MSKMKEFRSIIAIDFGDLLDETFTECYKFWLRCGINGKRDRTAYFLYLFFTKLIELYNKSKSKLIVFHVEKGKIIDLEKLPSTSDLYYKKIVKVIKNLKSSIIFSNENFDSFCLTIEKGSPIYDEVVNKWTSNEEIFQNFLTFFKKLKFKTLEEKFLSGKSSIFDFFQ